MLVVQFLTSYVLLATVVTRTFHTATASATPHRNALFHYQTLSKSGNFETLEQPGTGYFLHVSHQNHIMKRTDVTMEEYSRARRFLTEHLDDQAAVYNNMYEQIFRNHNLEKPGDPIKAAVWTMIKYHCEKGFPIRIPEVQELVLVFNRWPGPRVRAPQTRHQTGERHRGHA
ncbi:hypothetical protein BC835DRAFT_1348033 [Cytidiella melzeri]|nr:hypothetical protein BC835DRAFT_1348033 [Cytidiella melzeri]